MFEHGLDTLLAKSINALALHHPWFANAAVFSASSLSNALVALLILYLVTRADSPVKLTILVLSVMVVAWLTARGIQSFWFRARPFEAGVAHALIPHRGSSSFPSTHASVIFAVGWLGVALRKHWHCVGLWWVLGLTVVSGRVISGLHYPSDVFAGLAIGMASAAIGVTAGKQTGLLPRPDNQP